MSLEKFLRGIVLTGIFAVPFIPLIVAQSMFFPFITGKNFTFRIVVEIIFALWLALAFVNPEYRPRRSWTLYALAFFVLMIGISDVFGANPMKSIWSNFERMEGWVTLAHLLMFFTVVISMLNQKLWHWFWHTSIGVSVLIGFYGVFQLMGWITINQGGMRLDATFGNAIYLGIYMLFHLFITAFMWENRWREGKSNWGLGIAYGTIMALQAFILFFTASRGVMLGLIGGAFLSALILVIFSSHSKNAWRASVGVVTGILVLTGVFFLVRDAAFMQNIVPLQRLSSISFSETTIKSRFLNAGMAIKGIQERPLLGWGQENYNIIFNKNYDPRMYGQEQWFDRTHNIIFDWLVAGGLIGFLAYVLIYITALMALWRSGGFSIPERSILTGLLAAYLFSVLFVFDNITSYIFFILVLAYIAGRSEAMKGTPRVFGATSAPRHTLAAFAGGAVLLAGGMVWSINWTPIQANWTLITALTPKSPEEGGIDKTLELFNQALAYNTFGNQEIREQIAQGAASAAGSNLTAEQKLKLFTLATDEMKKQEASAPEDARFPFFLGIIYGAYGQMEESIRHLERALELSPTKQTIKFQLAATKAQMGDKQGALDLLKSAYESAPDFPEPRIMYAAMLVEMGQSAQAEEIIKPLLEQGVAADQRLINVYLAQKRFDKIAQLWESKVRAQPNDSQARFALAASYYAAGNKQKTIEVLEQAAKDIPGIATQAASYIEQVKAGTIKAQ